MIEIKTAIKEDLEELLEVQKLAFQCLAELYNDYSIPPVTQSLQAIAEEFNSKLFLIAIFEQKIIGSVRAYSENNTCHIEKVFVHPDYQKKGIASQLLLEMEKRFNGVIKYELEVVSKSLYNISFYKKRGYLEIDSFKVREDITLVRMEKSNTCLEQQAYWDKVAPSKTFSHQINYEKFNEFVAKEAVILDYGCGYGRLLKELYEKGFTNLLGIDFSSGMIKRAQSELPDLRFLQNEKNSIPLENASVDVILLFAVLTCVHQDDIQQQILEEITRVLKKGGLIYISDFLLNSDQRNQQRYEKYSPKYDCYGVFELEEGGILRHHSKDRIQSIMSKFKTLYYSEFEVTTMNGNVSNAFQFIGSKS